MFYQLLLLLLKCKGVMGLTEGNMVDLWMEDEHFVTMQLSMNFTQNKKNKYKYVNFLQ